MKRLLKNKKALSPVVAAIILIAVTVAVSIAVAAWMGSLTIGFMETAEVTITNAAFTDGATAGSDTITLSAVNTGTSAATVATAKLNGATVTVNAASSMTIDAGGSETYTLSVLGLELAEGSKYSISIFASDGTLLSSYTATCIF